MATFEPNLEQRAAIEFGDGPLRIIAGAGTGKTATLTNRIVSLIERGAAKPSEILALTFTNKAVDELRNRVDEAVAGLAGHRDRVDVDTYHAFGGRVVSEFGYLVGLPQDPVVLTSAESWIVLWKAIDQIDFQFLDLGTIRGGMGGSPLKTAVNLGSRLRDELRTIDDLRGWLAITDDQKNAPKLADYLNILEVYRQRKLELGAIDYGDQIGMACELLTCPEVSSELGGRYRYLLVDEFQDTNYAQSEMVRLLAEGHHRNVSVVGDPNQAIYGFRGAAPETLERFATQVFPGTETKPLSSNYRSTQPILDLANAIWDNLEVPRGTALQSARDEPGVRPILAEAADLDSELRYIARTIQQMVADEGYDYGKIAVICRKNRAKLETWRLLRSYGIPAELTGGTSLLETPEVLELICYLRSIVDHRLDAPFAYVLMSDRWGLDERDVAAIAATKAKGETLQQAARRLAASGNVAPAVIACLQTLELLSQRSYAGLEPLVEAIVALRSGAYDATEAANVERFMDMVRALSRSRVERPNLNDLVAYLNLLMEAGDENEAAVDVGQSHTNTVKVLTAHSAKGLQWPVVFVTRATHSEFFNSGKKTSELLPYELAQASPGRPIRSEYPPGDQGDKAYAKAVEAWAKAQARREEFRVLYVALTRAEDRLIVTWSRNPTFHKKEKSLHPAFSQLDELWQHVEAPDSSEHPEPLSLEAAVMPTLELVNQLLNDEAISGDVEPAMRHELAAMLGAQGLDSAVSAEALALFDQQRGQLKEQLAIIREFDSKHDDHPVSTGADTITVSYSQIETFEQCPHRYYLRYRLGMPGAPYQRITGYGSALHRAVAGEASSRRLGQSTSHDSVEAAIQQDLQSTALPADRARADHREPFADPVAVYFDEVDAVAEPLLIEEMFALRLGNATLNGVIDRVHRLPDGTIEVVDYKTNRGLRSPEAVRDGLQLPIYLLACRDVFRELLPPPSRAAMFFLRHNQRIEQTYSDAELEAVRERIIATAEAMRTVDPSDHRALPETCGWCEYRATCQFAV